MCAPPLYCYDDPIFMQRMLRTWTRFQLMVLPICNDVACINIKEAVGRGCTISQLLPSISLQAQSQEALASLSHKDSTAAQSSLLPRRSAVHFRARPPRKRHTHTLAWPVELLLYTYIDLSRRCINLTGWYAVLYLFCILRLAYIRAIKSPGDRGCIIIGSFN